MSDVCLSGGAAGADQAWGLAFFSHTGHKIPPIHYSFEGHRKTPHPWFTVLTSEQLAEADPFLKEANKRLRRSFPSSSDFVNNLLRRNYFQVRDTEKVYAVGKIDFLSGLLEGGTSWAVQMYIDICVAKQTPPIVYVFDQNKVGWYEYNYSRQSWDRISQPPVPSGRWTGIGTRELTADGREAIEKVFEDH